MDTRRRIDIKTGSIGPAHDPYSKELVTVTLGNRKAQWYEDGLGRCKCWLTEGSQMVREFEWHVRCFGGMDKEAMNKQSLARLLFRRHVGIAPEEAIEEYGRNYRPDPYGSPSSYV